MSENHYAELANIDVSKYVEKKQNLSYLSWPFAVDQLMRRDSTANWVFNDPSMFGESMMVSCTVTAFGKPITMHLPVMDHRNQAIKNPNAFEVNKNMMRCLVKAIACHGLGIQLYAGEDLPLEDLSVKDKPKVEAKEPSGNIATPKPPAKIEGREGPWQLNVKADPSADMAAWTSIVTEACKLALEQCLSKVDVMSIFKVNRNIFDRMKADSPDEYTQLMALFKERKEFFKEQ
jgi:hypothetical protein